MEIVYLLKSNLKTKKGTMSGIFILLFLISFSLITILNVNKNAAKRYEEASLLANTPDITAVIKENSLPIHYQKRLEKDPAVSSVKIVPKIYVDEFFVNQKKFSEIHSIGPSQKENHVFQVYKDNSFKLDEDNNLHPDPGEIFLPIGCQNRYKCDLGDTVNYTINNKTLSFKIAKFIEEPFSGCTLMGMKRVFINAKDYSMLESFMDIREKELQIYFSNKTVERSDAILRRLSLNENLSEISSFLLTKQDSQMFTMIFTNILCGILGAFSILLLVIIAIIIGFNINMSLEMEYQDIGILKSQGFTSHKIQLLFLLQYLISGAAGCIAGLILSGLGVRFISQYFVPVTGLFISHKADFVIGCILIMLILLLLILFIMIKTQKIKKISPLQAINGCTYKRHRPNAFKYRIYQSPHVPLPFRLVIKSLTGNFRQYISLTIIIGLLLFFLISTASIKQIKNYDNVSSMFGGSTGEIQITFQDKIDETIINSIKKEVQADTSIEKIFKCDIQYIGVDGLQYMGNVVDSKGILPPPVKGREPETDREIIITETLSKILEKEVGDTVTLSLNQIKKDYVIVGLNYDTSDVGKCFGILETGIQRLDHQYNIRKVDISIQNKAQTGSIIASLKTSFANNSNFQIHNQYQNILEQSKFIIIAVNSITALIYALALFFVAVITYIICSKIFAMEQTDMGIYKSLGASADYIRLPFILRFLTVSIIGCVFGFVLHLLLGQSLISTLLGGIGFQQVTMNFSPLDYILPTLFICLTTLTFAWLSSKKIKRITPLRLIEGSEFSL